MKTILSFTLFLIVSSFAGAQGSIIDLTISPEYPTNTDTIYVYVDLRFTSGECMVSEQSHTISGFDINANAHHCLGLFDFICSTTDTFKINPLPNGGYNFNLNLTSGLAPAPCTPGIVADDDSTYRFTVGTAGLDDRILSSIAIYPNPVKDQLNFADVPDGTEYKLSSVSGQIVRSGAIENEHIMGLGDLPEGLYFLQLTTSNGMVVKQVVKE